MIIVLPIFMLIFSEKKFRDLNIIGGGAGETDVDFALQIVYECGRVITSPRSSSRDPRCRDGL